MGVLVQREREGFDRDGFSMFILFPWFFFVVVALKYRIRLEVRTLAARYSLKNNATHARELINTY